MAKLIFKYATMNSGKTLDLIRTIFNYEENNCRVLLLKPQIDIKGDDKVVTRVGLERKVDFLVSSDDCIMILLSGQLEDIKCIFVDEAQFLTKRQIDELFVITKVLNIPVICYGLRDNFKMCAFDGSLRLLEIADTLEEFKTLCYCGETARYCGRMINGEYVMVGDDVVIDGTNDVTYVPLCGEHYLKNVSKIDFDEVKKLVKK